MQLGCAGVDLPKREQFFGSPILTSKVNDADLRTEKHLEQAGIQKSQAPQPSSLNGQLARQLPETRPTVSAESSGRLTQIPEWSLRPHSRPDFTPGRFSWRPHLLIRANDESVEPLDEIEGVVTRSEEEATRSSENFPSDFNPANNIGEVEYAVPLEDESFALDFGRERWRRVKSDYQNFYSQPSLLRLGAGFLLGAAMANTAFDRNFTEDVYRDNVIDIANEDLAQTLHEPKTLGDGYILLPTLGVLALSQPLLERSEWTSPLGELGDRGARAILVGGPVVLLTQNLTGGSRPYESPSGSHWEPFQDNNGVSGHAFVGAVPFLAAGKMSHRPLVKAAWYTASVLPALSRVNDDRHYFSQAFLGWYVAWLATTAVDNSQQRPNDLRIMPTVSPLGTGLMLEKQF